MGRAYDTFVQWFYGTDTEQIARELRALALRITPGRPHGIKTFRVSVEELFPVGKPALNVTYVVH
jgi:hypothetical protein